MIKFIWSKRISFKNLLHPSFVLFILSSCDLTTADEYYNRAIDLAEKARWEEAILSLDKAIDERPKFRPALFYRGYYKTNLGDFEGGIEDYNRLLEFDSDNTSTLVNVGFNYGSLGNHKKAILFYSKALNTEGAINRNIDSLGRLRFIYSNRRVETFDDDKNYNIPDYEIYYERGVQYLIIDHLDKAISDFNKSVRFNYQLRDTYYLLGMAYLGKKDSINSCRYFIKSTKLGNEDAREKLQIHCIKVVE